MSQTDRHDDVLLNILKDEGQILPFLNSIFGFLYRRTDFYIVQNDPSSKVGFPPGVSERVVRDTFRKWLKLSTICSHQHVSPAGDSVMPDVVMREEEVVTSDACVIAPADDKLSPIQDGHHREEDVSSETFNGADCGSYRWSQTLTEVDIKVPVPGHVLRSGDVTVEVGAEEVLVRVREEAAGEGEWASLLAGRLTHRHQREESIWTLLPGKQVTIHLEKDAERWWDSLLTTETKLDLSKLDVSRSAGELQDEDHMAVERVMVEGERKRLGLPSLDHQKNLEKLKQAWDAEGSPFKGTPFDPSVLHMS